VSGILDDLFPKTLKVKKPKFNVGVSTYSYYRDKGPDLSILLRPNPEVIRTQDCQDQLDNLVNFYEER